jgi:hypothetical protein
MQEWAHQGVTECALQTCAPQKLKIDAGANTSLTRRADPPNDSGSTGAHAGVTAMTRKKNWGECTLVVVEWAHQRVTECIAIVCAAEIENRCRRQYFTHSPCQPSRGLGQLERARWGVQQRGAIERSACTRVHCCTYMYIVTRHRCARNTATGQVHRSADCLGATPSKAAHGRRWSYHR